METRTRQLTINTLISAIAFIALVVHLLNPALTFDTAALVLILLAVAPWIASVLKAAELPGGWKFEFQAVRAEQERQAHEIRALRFLMSCFLTHDEYRHLRRLASGEPFTFKRDGTAPFFEAELRRLRALGLIQTPEARQLSPLFADDGTTRDVRDFVRVTEQGKLYLLLREQVGTDG